MYLPTSAGVLARSIMTGSEAVGKYIYISERPPGNIISSFNFKNHLNPAFSTRPLPYLTRKHDISMISMMNTAPMQAVKHPNSSETFNAVPNRKKLTDYPIHYT